MTNPRALVLLVPLLLAGCTDPGSGPEPVPTPTPAPRSSATPRSAPDPSLRVPGEVQEVFDLDCTRCHSGGGGSAGLSLDAERAYAAIVERKSSQASKMNLVAPGEPELSYLLHKMLGTQLDVGGHGARMPQMGSWGANGSLSDAEVARVRRWIEAGAPAEQ
ncbi:MAG: hypothetical protein JKY65_26050 [Planctomycetes bacterium]|nr:hypothetical protein [Planctomycetota bacterium]